MTKIKLLLVALFLIAGVLSVSAYSTREKKEKESTYYWYHTQMVNGVLKLTGPIVTPEVQLPATGDESAQAYTGCLEESNFECARAFTTQVSGPFPKNPPSAGVDHLYRETNP